jgi:hypothetical protein
MVGGAMRCLMCDAEMTLMTAIPDSTMPVAGFERHTFMCPHCGDVERRLTFVKRDRDTDDASPTIVPDQTGPAADAPAERLRHADVGRFSNTVTRLLRRPRSVARRHRDQ